MQVAPKLVDNLPTASLELTQCLNCAHKCTQHCVSCTTAFCPSHGCMCTDVVPPPPSLPFVSRCRGSYRCGCTLVGSSSEVLPPDEDLSATIKCTPLTPPRRTREVFENGNSPDRLPPDSLFWSSPSPRRELQLSLQPLWVISLCDGLGIPRLAVSNALPCLSSRGTHWVIERVVTVERDTVARGRASELLSFYRCSEADQHIDELGVWGDQPLTHGFWPNDRLLVLLVGTDCNSLSSMAPHNRDGPPTLAGLHISPSSSHHMAVSGLVRLCQAVPSWNLMVIHEQVRCANSRDEQELDFCWGRGLIHTACRYNPVPQENSCRIPGRSLGGQVRTRVFRTTPTLPIGTTLAHNWFGPPPNWPKGVFWPMAASRTASIVSPPTLRAALPSIVSRAASLGFIAKDCLEIGFENELHKRCKAQSYRAWSENEISDLQMLCVRTASGIRYASVHEWSAWMGLRHECFSTASCTCVTRTRILSGNTQTFVTDPCGKREYCPWCAELLSIIGKAWHFGVASDIIATVFLRYAAHPDGGPVDRDNYPCPHNWPRAYHHCKANDGGTCEHRLTSASREWKDIYCLYP